MPTGGNAHRWECPQAGMPTSQWVFTTVGIAVDLGREYPPAIRHTFPIRIIEISECRDDELEAKSLYGV